MAYLGRGIDKISNVETLDNITFDGSSSYSITKGSSAFVPNSSQSCLLSIDGVVQSGNFTVSGSTIDFGVAISSSSTCNFFLHFGTGLVTTPSDGSVTRDKLNLVSDGSNPSLIAKGTSGVSEGYIQLNCAENSHGVKIKSPPHSAGQSYTLTLPQSITNNTFLKTDGSGNLSFASAGKILQVVNSSTSTQVGFSTVSVNTFLFEASITPSSTSNKILALYDINGIASNAANANRMEIIGYWNTSSGGTTGTVLNSSYSATDNGPVQEITSVSFSSLFTPATTSTIYVKARAFTHDTNNVRYVNVYGSNSTITLMEIAG